jgi:hypothetical protein
MKITSYLYWKSGLCPGVDRSFNFGSTCKNKEECVAEIEKDINATIEKLQNKGYTDVKYDDSTGIISYTKRSKKVEAYRFGIKKVVRTLSTEEEEDIAKSYIENLTGKTLEDFITA